MQRLCLLLLFTAQPALAANHDGQVWTTIFTRATVAPRVVAHLDAGARFSIDRNGLATALIRGTLDYAVSDKVELNVAVARFTTYNDGRETQNENRLHQQISGTIARIGAVDLSSRTRLEQRFVSTGEDTGWRLRQQFRAIAPLTKGSRTRGYLASETFIAFNDTDWGANKGLDQVRTAFGVAFPAGNKLTADIGYINQWSNLERREDIILHIVNIALTANF